MTRYTCSECGSGVAFAALSERETIATLRSNGWRLTMGRAVCAECATGGRLEQRLRHSVRVLEGDEVAGEPAFI
jgi:hypothetical protein